MVPIGAQSVGLSDDWAQKLASYATEDEATASGDGGWSWISLDGAVFTYEDAQLPSPISVVVLGARFENLLYKGAYDPNKLTGVTCYAIGDDLSTLAPPADLATKESASCAHCWANVYGTDPKRGKGKACSNKVRIAVLPFDVDNQSTAELQKVDGARLRIPPTGQKSWAVFVKKVTKALRRPLFAVVTSLKVSPDPIQRVKLEFDALGTLENPAFLEVLESRLEEAKEQLSLPPALAADREEVETPKTRKSGLKEKVTKKSSGAKTKKVPAGNMKKF